MVGLSKVSNEKISYLWKLLNQTAYFQQASARPYPKQIGIRTLMTQDLFHAPLDSWLEFE